MTLRCALRILIIIIKINTMTNVQKEANKLVDNLSNDTINVIVNRNVVRLRELLTKDKDYNIYCDDSISSAIREVVFDDEDLYKTFEYEDYENQYDDVDDVVDSAFVELQDKVCHLVYNEYRKDLLAIMSYDESKNDEYLNECFVDNKLDFSTKSELYNTSEIIVDEMIASRDDKVKARDAQSIKEIALIEEYYDFLIEEYVDIIKNKYATIVA